MINNEILINFLRIEYTPFVVNFPFLNVVIDNKI